MTTADTNDFLGITVMVLLAIIAAIAAHRSEGK